MESKTSALIRAAQKGDEQAMEALILPHKPLLRRLASRFYCPYISTDELMQAGYVGLMRAILRYDDSQGTALLTYAVPWILGEIRSLIREASWQSSVLSLDQQRSEESSATLLDEISSVNSISVERIDLMQAFRSLPQKEQMVICLRYFRDKTQKETAELLGCSQAQISKTERRAIDRMHASMA